MIGLGFLSLIAIYFLIALGLRESEEIVDSSPPVPPAKDDKDG